MWRVAALCIALMIVAPPVWADPATDCDQGDDQDTVIRGCTERIRRESGDAAAYNNRGVAYGEKGEVDRAIADYTKAIQINPKFADAYANRCRAYNHKKEQGRAITDCNKAIEIDPKYAQAYLMRCKVYLDKKEPGRAITDCTKSIEIDPSSANAYVVSAYHWRGMAYESQGDLERAFMDFDEALRRDPEFSAALAGRILVIEAARSACTQVQDRARQVRGCSVIIRFSGKQATPLLAMATSSEVSRT